MALYREHISSSFRNTGALKGRLVAFAFFDEASRAQGRWWGSDHPEHAIPFGSSGGELDFVFAENSNRHAVVMDEVVFQTKFEALTGYAMEYSQSTAGFLPADAGIFSQSAARLSRLLARARSDRNLSGEELENQVMEVFVDQLIHPAQPVMSGSMAKALVVRAIEHLEQHDFSLTVATLCQRIRCGRRTLEKAFMTHLGVSPGFFVRSRRLRLCHEHLRMSDPQATTVGEIARRFGFNSLGQFSATYREWFGVNPYETLRRPFVVNRVMVNWPKHEGT